MRTSHLCLSVLLLCVLSIQYAAAAQRDSDRTVCGMSPGGASSAAQKNKVIDACTRLLDKGDKLSVEERVYAYRKRGFAHRMAYQLDLAVADYSSAIELSPDDSTLYANRGISWPGDNVKDREFVDFSRAIELNPRNWTALSYRGVIFARRGEFANALADYTSAVQVYDQQEYVRRRGYLNYIVGDMEAATDDFTLLRSKLPREARAVLWLYISQKRAGIRTADEELRINALMLKSSKWPAPVVQVLLGRKPPQLLWRHPRRCESRFYLGQWYLFQGELNEARTALTSAAAACPANRFYLPPNFWMKTAAKADLERLSGLELARGKEQDASPKRDIAQELKERFDDLLKVENDISIELRAKTLAERAKVHHSVGAYERAIDDLNEAIRFDSMHEHFLARCGVYAHKGSFEDAKADCLTAAKLGRRRGAYRRLGLVRFAFGDYENAIADFEQWSKSDYREREAKSWIHLARVRLGKANPLRDLRTLARKVKKDDPQRALMDFFLNNGVPANVLPDFDRCSAMLFTGQWYILRGQSDRARVALEKAIKIQCNKDSDQYLVAQADLNRLDAVVTAIAANRQRSQDDAMRRHSEGRERIVGFDRMIKQHRERLGKDGRPYFSFGYQNGAWGYVNYGCLIGEKGKVYVYNVKLSDTMLQTYSARSQDYERAVHLVSRLQNRTIVPEGRAFDAGFGSWVATNGGTSVALKIIGNARGKLDDPVSKELVQLINKWCPSASRQSASALRLERTLKLLEQKARKPDKAETQK